MLSPVENRQTIIQRLTPEDVDFIKNALRQASVKWRGRRDCLRRARKKVLAGHTKSGAPVYKYHWKCADCGRWFLDPKELEVDHITEIGALVPTIEGIGEFVLRVLAEPESLQAMCLGCHLSKTKRYASARSRWRRKHSRGQENIDASQALECSDDDA